MASISSKRQVDVVTLQFNFADQARFLETLTTPVVTVTVASGTDASPSSILSGSPSLSGLVVSQKIAAGMAGVQYIVSCTVNSSTTSAVYRIDRQLSILSTLTSYAPSSLPVVSGVLPNGIVGATYSNSLSISGGYAPYAPDGVASGTFPTWMGFTVLGNSLVCAGVPNEAVETNYTFAPQILDSALNNASAPQNITITRTTVVGDFPDGVTGQVVNFQYTAVGGTAPYTFSISSGALPTGTSMDSAGLVTGTITAPGSPSWQVMAVDANGVSGTLNDSAVILNGLWWVTNEGTIPLDNDLYISSDPLSFGAATTRTPNITPGYGPKGVTTNVVLVAPSSLGTSDLERITDMTPPITTVLQGSFPFNALRHIRVIDGIVFLIPQLGTTYSYSTDFGETWLTGQVPGSPDMSDIARLDNGRWLTLVTGLTGGFYYSDVALPTGIGNWIFAGVTNPGGAGHAEGYIATNANTAVSFGTTNVKRTSDGVTWTAVPGPSDSDRRDGLSVNGVYICQSGQDGSLFRSTDFGFTWTEIIITTPGEVFQRIELGGPNGTTVVACTSSGQMWVSTDDGLNWTQNTTAGPVSGHQRAAFVLSST